MLVAVIINHRLSPRASAQFGAEGKCSENILATMRSDAIRNKPATRNRIVRMRPILRTEVDRTCSAPNAMPLTRKRVKRRVQDRAVLKLQVFRIEPRPFCNSRKHSRTNLLIIMKRKHKIGPASTGECTMRAGLALDDPADAKKRGQHKSGTRARPLAHAAAKEILTRSGPASPCSRRSATTRSARA